MAKVKAILFKGKKLKDGTHPIMIRVIHNRKVMRISVGHSVNEDFWDEESGYVKNDYGNAESLNSVIRRKFNEIEKAILKLEAEKEDFTHEELMGRLRKTKTNLSFIDFTQKIIDEMRNANKIGNSKIYYITLGVIKNFIKKSDLSFNEIDYKFLKRFETYHLGKEGNTINGLSVYLRTIRAIYNRAIHEGIVKSESYPFIKYKIRSQKTLKRAISKEDIIKIRNLELVDGTELWHSKNYFLFSFYMIGMSWIDMANLKVKDINPDRLYYKRKKTGKEYSIKLNEGAKEILTYYIADKQEKDYVFPIIKREANPVEALKDINNALKIHNKSLKEIAKQAGIQANLTSYVSRHSWASIANFSNVPIGIISEGLGHGDIKTTQTYLANFEHTDIDKANDLISNL